MNEQHSFERSILLLFVIALLSTVLAGLGVWYLLGEVIGVSSIFVVIGALITWLGTAVFLGHTVAKTALKPVAAAQKAVAHMSHEATEDQSAPPEEESDTLGAKFTSQIVHDIYSVAAGQNDTRQQLTGSLEFNQAILDLQANAVFTLDRNGVISFANRTAQTLIPESIDSAIGLSLEDAVSPEFSSGLAFGEWLSSTQADKISDSYVWERVRVMNYDESARYFDMHATYTKNESHGVEVILVLVDKTGSYHHDDKAIDFVSLAVHELRSPISLLRGYIEVFEDEVGPSLDDELRPFMNKMNASAGQLSTFVNNILNVARIENDQLKVHLQKRAISEVLQSSQEDFLLRATVRKRSLEYMIEDDLPEVGVDSVGIYEVMSNLIDNAIKYSPEDGKITIKAEKSNGGGVTVTVTDTGIGMPANAIENLFERFYRSHHSKNNVAGTGLGLFLSKTLIEAHGGTIWVKSTEGEGSTFGFDLPSFESVKENGDLDESGAIVQSAHGWIKNHGKMRG